MAYVNSLAATAQRAFQQKYPNQTATNLIDTRQQGGDVSGSTPLPKGAVGANTRNPTPGTNPALASQNEASLPGFHTGNTDPGVPRAEQGMGIAKPTNVPGIPGIGGAPVSAGAKEKPMPGMGGVRTGTVPPSQSSVLLSQLRQVIPTAGAQMATPSNTPGAGAAAGATRVGPANAPGMGPAPTPTTAPVSPSNVPGGVNRGGTPIPFGVQVPPGASQLPPGMARPNDAPTAMAQAKPGETAAAAETPGATAETPVAANSEKPWQDANDTRSFQEQFGQGKPANWENWDQGKRESWKASHYQPLPGAGAGAGAGTGGDAGAGAGTGGDAGTGAQPGTAATTTSTFNQSDPATYWNEDGTPTWSAEDIRAVEGDDRNFLQAKPDGFAGWTRERKDQWLANNYNPYGTIDAFLSQAPDSAVLSAFQRITGDSFKGTSGLPPVGGAGQLPAQPIPDEANPRDWSHPESPYYVENESIRSLLDGLQNVSTNLDQLAQTPEGYGSKEWNTVWGKYAAGIAMLKRYGIQYDPQKNRIGSTGPGNTPGVTDERTDQDIGDTDLPTNLPSFDRYIADIKRALNGVGGQNSAAFLEFAMQRAQLEQAMQNRQKGVNILQPGLEAAQNNPFRQQSEAAMLEALQNPDPTDWEGIKNRYASDVQRTNLTDQMGRSASAARRGVPLGAMVGLEAGLGAQQNNSLSRGLSEMENQQALQGRSSLYDALNQSANVYKNYQGAEDIWRQTLANAVMGTPQAAQNPYSGLADTRLAQQQIQLQEQAMRDAEEASRRAMWGQIGGALLGAGGSMGAAAIMK